MDENKTIEESKEKEVGDETQKKNEEIEEKDQKKEEEEKKEEIKRKEVKEEIKEDNNIENNEEQKEGKDDNKTEEKNEDNNENNKEEKKDNNSNEIEIKDETLKSVVTMKIVDNDFTYIDKVDKNKYELPKDFIDDKNRCNTLTQKLVNKTKRNANMKLDEFFTKKRHYLIMTDGGKPVYSRYGDEVENNSIFATISAMITKFTIFNSTESYKEEINIISNNKNKIVFMKKGQLIFIALTKYIDDCVSLLHSQLEYIYNQLMSILTVRFYEKLEDNPSKCLTAMGGTENLFEQIIQYSSNSFISIFNSYQVMNFVNYDGTRDKINKILEENKGNSLYCILMTPYEMISFAHSNQIMVTPSDLILIQNLIFCTEMLRTQESYVPICLPGISDQGFLQLYSHFSEDNIGVIFVTENMDPMCFMEFQKMYNDIYEKINTGYKEKIIECMRKNNNTKGKYCLFKDNENKKKEINDEDLINKLLNKIKKEKGMQVEENKEKKEKKENKETKEKKDKKENAIDAKDLSRTKTVSAFNSSNNNIINLKSGEAVFGQIKYGVVMSKKYNQYIMINFGMDYRTYDKKEKKLIHRYTQLYDKYNNTKDKDKDKDKDEFYYMEKSDKYYDVIQVNENFIIICSFSFFTNIEAISKKLKEVLKYLKKNENKYFIIYK